MSILEKALGAVGVSLLLSELLALELVAAKAVSLVEEEVLMEGYHLSKKKTAAMYSAVVGVLY